VGGSARESGGSAAGAAAGGSAHGSGSAELAPAEVRIDLPLPFLLPEEYVAAADARVLLYRRLAAADTAEAVMRIEDHLLHEYGAPPAPAQNLIDRARAKVLAAKLNVANITLQRGKLVLEPVELGSPQAAALKSRGALYLVKSKRLTYPIQQGAGTLNTLLILLDELADVSFERR
jgi:transcription-repair coupling factor (superfamily II helicase)